MRGPRSPGRAQPVHRRPARSAEPAAGTSLQVEVDVNRLEAETPQSSCSTAFSQRLQLMPRTVQVISITAGFTPCGVLREEMAGELERLRAR